jgi:hypothetical protein
VLSILLRPCIERNKAMGVLDLLRGAKKIAKPEEPVFDPDLILGYGASSGKPKPSGDGMLEVHEQLRLLRFTLFT